MAGKNEIKIFAAITIITALGTAAGSALSPVEVRFLATLTSDTTLIGARYSFTAALAGIFSIIVGRLSSRYGKRGFILTGAILSVVYPLLYAASSNIFQYMGAGIIAAFTGASLSPLMASMLQDSLAKNKSRGKYLGISYAASAIMGSIGAFIGGVVADAYGLKAPYYVDAFLEILAAIMLIVFLAGYKNHKTPSVKKYVLEKRDILFSIKYILKDPALVFHFIIETAFGLYWTMKPIVFPLAIFAIAKSNMATGSVFAAMGFVAMIVLPFAGHYIDRRGYLKGAKIGFLILGISSIAIAFSDTLAAFLIFASIFAIGEAINGPVAGVIQMKRIKNQHRSELMGFYFAHSAALSIISPLIAGALLAFMPPSKVLLIYAIFLWVGIAAAFGTLKKQKI